MSLVRFGDGGVRARNHLFALSAFNERGGVLQLFGARVRLFSDLVSLSSRLQELLRVLFGARVLLRLDRLSLKTRLFFFGLDTSRFGYFRISSSLFLFSREALSFLFKYPSAAVPRTAADK